MEIGQRLVAQLNSDCIHLSILHRWIKTRYLPPLPCGLCFLLLLASTLTRPPIFTGWAKTASPRLVCPCSWWHLFIELGYEGLYIPQTGRTGVVVRVYTPGSKAGHLVCRHLLERRNGMRGARALALPLFSAPRRVSI